MTASGRTAIITGSTAGMGLAVAEALVASGVNVLLHGSDLDATPTAAERLTATYGARTAADGTDLACAASPPALVKRRHGTAGTVTNGHLAFALWIPSRATSGSAPLL